MNSYRDRSRYIFDAAFYFSLPAVFTMGPRKGHVVCYGGNGESREA